MNQGQQTMHQTYNIVNRLLENHDWKSPDYSAYEDCLQSIRPCDQKIKLPVGLKI